MVDYSHHYCCHYFLLWSYCGVLKKVQDESEGTAVQANEEVDARQRDICCAGNVE